MNDTVWRLLIDPPADGETNMAVDAALLAAVAQGRLGPTLRLYGWSTPTLSLGYTQKETDVDADACARHGVPVVRRPTGGRAVYHDDEVTYAVAVPETSRWFGSLAQVYRLAEWAVEEALKRLNVPVDYADKKEAGVRSGCCFSSRTRHEITVGGKKVVASAQRRIRGGALQHGSVILSIDARRYVDLLRWPDPARRDEALRLMGGINDGRLFGAIAPAAVRDAVVDSFVALYGVTMAPLKSRSDILLPFRSPIR